MGEATLSPRVVEYPRVDAEELLSPGSGSWVVEMEKTIGDMNIDPAVEMARWKRHSIYRVPERIKNLHNSKSYQPELVSLGPFHHGDQELLPMEEHKRRAVVHLVKRSGKPLREFVAAVAEVTQQLQDAYKDLSDEWHGPENSERFVELMVTDGCFLVEAMRMDALRGKVHEDYAPNDPVFSKYGYLYLWNYIQSDMVVVENQLPLLLLQRLLVVLDHDRYQQHTYKDPSQDLVPNKLTIRNDGPSMDERDKHWSMAMHGDGSKHVMIQEKATDEDFRTLRPP